LTAIIDLTHAKVVVVGRAHIKGLRILNESLWAIRADLVDMKVSESRVFAVYYDVVFEEDAGPVRFHDLYEDRKVR
jgi:hypothetical protein